MAKELTKEQIERKEKREKDRKQTIKSLKKIAKLTVLDDAFNKMLPKRENIKKRELLATYRSGECVKKSLEIK